LHNGKWENCSGFVHIHNYVRCVFAPSYQKNPVNAQNHSNDRPINIAPNPFTKKIHLENTTNLAIRSIQIKNIMGKTIKSLSINSCQKDIYLKLNALEEGVYCLILTLNEPIPHISKKIIKLS
jgi:hypothetical protein